MNFYSIRHLTRFRYSRPISESIMETRMHPRSDSNQHCLTFTLSVSPRCRVFSYRDHQGNNVQHFDIPGEHNQLVIVAESVIEQQALPDVPRFLSPEAWGDLDELVESGDYWEMLLPSTFAVETPALTLLAKQMGVTRRDDPLMLVQELNQRLFEYFEYEPRSTRVDSPIDEAIVSGKGVCQDFAHTMIALLRHVKIPARYVSGYLYRSREDHDRSTPDATHAWVDVLLPQLGWVGFDPDQQSRRASSPHPHCGGPRLRRRAAHARHLPRQHGQRALCGRACGGQRRAAGSGSQAADPRRLERAGGARPAAARVADSIYRFAADAAATTAVNSGQ